MRRIAVLLTSTVAAVAIFTGCEPDKRGIKVAPQTEMDSKSEVGYGDDYRSDDYAEEVRYEDTGRPEELGLITVYFDYDRFELTPEALDIMSANADHLWNKPLKVVLIEGHCDERGTEEYNLALGEKRARAVRDYLVKYGINPERISVISYGESTPADYGHGEKAWAKNRRAQFTVLSE
ncbi:MAG: peptidoglycan-associated lipoprotein Pal [Candidatus Zixiibacteriota bacterium]|nr:MAG: peptidoglycan-associated lipoprotein Pal [candidate division Zixibacteria bacterium]